MSATIIQGSTREQPPHGAMFCTDAIIRANRESGSHYFDADTMRFFGSRVLDGVYGGRFFVTSERTGFDRSSPRAYSVREFMPDGTIETYGEFNGYATAGTARTAARNAAKTTHRYYFDGQHGKGGRKRCYVVSGAVDPWHALDALHANFRVRFCGRADDDRFTNGAHYVQVSA